MHEFGAYIPTILFPDIHPTPTQELLLRAAMFSGDDALAAWREYKTLNPLDTIDIGSERLLGMLYMNLQRLHIDDPMLTKLRERYERTRDWNRLVFDNAGTIISTLERNGVETLVVKGLALIPLYYKDPGLRYMYDIDILIKPSQIRAALNTLVEAGWQPQFGSLAPLTDRYVKLIHEHTFVREPVRLDLHWHLMFEHQREHDDDDYWNTSIPLNLGSCATRTLDATNQLFHTCMHGVLWSENSSIRWIMDAVIILRSPDTRIDWDRLISQATQKRFTLVLLEGLSYLRQKMGADIPDHVLNALKSAPVISTQKKEFHIRTHGPTFLWPLKKTWYRFVVFSPWAEGVAWPTKIFRFIRYFPILIWLRGWQDVPRYVLKYVRRRFP